MEKALLKKDVKNMLNDLPDDADWDDVMYKIYVRQSIEQGLKDSEAGPHRFSWRYQEEV